MPRADKGLTPDVYDAMLGPAKAAQHAVKTAVQDALSPKPRDPMAAGAVRRQLAPKVLWRPHSGFQTRALQRPEFEVLIGGAAGGGKTDVLIMAGTRDVDNPHERVLFLRRTFPELQEVMDRVALLFPQMGATYKASERRWYWPSGATYEFGYCETMADALRYRGQEFSKLLWDEIGDIPDEKTYLFVRSRVRAPVGAKVRLQAMLSANPGGAGHPWLVRRFIEPCGLNGERVYHETDPVTGLSLARAFVPGRLSDNPSLGPEYRANLLGMDERTRRQLLDGDWTAGVMLAFSELDWATHRCDPIPMDMVPPWWATWFGYDWGFEHHWAAVALAMDENGTIYIMDVQEGWRQYDYEHAARLLNEWPPRFRKLGYAGHDCFARHVARGGANVQTTQEIFAGAGIALTRAAIERVEGWRILRHRLARPLDIDGRLGPPRLRFCDTPRVRGLFDMMRLSTSDPDRVNDVRKVDTDRQTGTGGDDALDALRYGVVTRLRAADQPKPDPLTSPDAHRRDVRTLDAILRPLDETNGNSYDAGGSDGLHSHYPGF